MEESPFEGFDIFPNRLPRYYAHLQGLGQRLDPLWGRVMVRLTSQWLASSLSRRQSFANSLNPCSLPRTVFTYILTTAAYSPTRPQDPTFSVHLLCYIDFVAYATLCAPSSSCPRYEVAVIIILRLPGISRGYSATTQGFHISLTPGKQTNHITLPRALWGNLTPSTNENSTIILQPITTSSHTSRDFP